MSKDKKSKQKITWKEEEEMYKSFGFSDYFIDEPLKVETIEKIVNFFENYQINDIYEGPHGLEDSIMTIFISQLAENMYKKSEITKLAKAIERLNEAVNKIGRYYA